MSNNATPKTMARPSTNTIIGLLKPIWRYGPYGLQGSNSLLPFQVAHEFGEKTTPIDGAEVVNVLVESIEALYADAVGVQRVARRMIRQLSRALIRDNEVYADALRRHDELGHP